MVLQSSRGDNHLWRYIEETFAFCITNQADRKDKFHINLKVLFEIFYYSYSLKIYWELGGLADIDPRLQNK